MKNLNIDMWYEDSPEDADRIDISFYANEGCYRGNIYKNGKCSGNLMTRGKRKSRNALRNRREKNRLPWKKLKNIARKEI